MTKVSPLIGVQLVLYYIGKLPEGIVTVSTANVACI